MRKILLDTNAYSQLLLGDRSVLKELADADHVYMTVFVLAELYYGFRLGSRRQENYRDLQRFLAKPTIRQAYPTKETALVYAEKKEELKLKGTPIPNNDLWIAAHSIELGARLVTFDGHFRKIAGILLWERPS